MEVYVLEVLTSNWNVYGVFEYKEDAERKGILLKEQIASDVADFFVSGYEVI